MPKSSDTQTGPSSGSVLSFMAELTKSLSPVLGRAPTEDVHELKKSIHLIRDYVGRLLDNGVPGLSTEKIDELCAEPLESLGLSRRPCNSVLNRGAKTIGQLARMTWSDLLSVRNLDDISAHEIRTKLKKRGLSLGLSRGVCGAEKKTLKKLFLNQNLWPIFAYYEVAEDFLRQGISTAQDFIDQPKVTVLQRLAQDSSLTTSSAADSYEAIEAKIQKGLLAIDAM